MHIIQRGFNFMRHPPPRTRQAKARASLGISAIFVDKMQEVKQYRYNAKLLFSLYQGIDKTPFVNLLNYLDARHLTSIVKFINEDAEFKNTLKLDNSEVEKVINLINNSIKYKNATEIVPYSISNRK